MAYSFVHYVNSVGVAEVMVFLETLERPDLIEFGYRLKVIRNSQNLSECSVVVKYGPLFALQWNTKMVFFYESGHTLIFLTASSGNSRKSFDTAIQYMQSDMQEMENQNA